MLTTERLILRQWKAEDLPAFARLNADAEVMEYFPSVLSTDESNAMAKKIQALIRKNGWGFWATELKKTGEFIGFVGLHETDSSLPFPPSIEIGWRLEKIYWQQGYACEAAKSALNFAFSELEKNTVIAFTTLNNKRSQAVMQRIGMHNSQQNFIHPDAPKKHALAEHVLYRINKPA